MKDMTHWHDMMTYVDEVDRGGGGRGGGRGGCYTHWGEDMWGGRER